MIFSIFQKKMGFWVFLVHATVVSGATIHIGQEMLCLPYAGFFLRSFSIQVSRIKLNLCLIIQSHTTALAQEGKL